VVETAVLAMQTRRPILTCMSYNNGQELYRLIKKIKITISTLTWQSRKKRNGIAAGSGSLRGKMLLFLQLRRLEWEQVALWSQF